MSRSNYEQLKVAVQDLLDELRIDSRSLGIMAAGYSPAYSTIAETDALATSMGFDTDNTWRPCPAVQLSKVVAGKLLVADIGDEKSCNQTTFEGTIEIKRIKGHPEDKNPDDEEYYGIYNSVFLNREPGSGTCLGYLLKKAGYDRCRVRVSVEPVELVDDDE